MKKEKETVYDIEALYLGERVGLFRGNIRQYFRDKTGREYAFSGVKNVYFGESYLVSKAGQILVRPTQPKTQTLFPNEADNLAFEAQKELVKHARAMRRKAMELKKPHRDIVKALELLRPFCRSLDNLNLRRFVDYLETQLSKKVRKK